MDPNSLLGNGPVSPLRRAGSDFVNASGVMLVEASILQILGTDVGELPWFQEFGTKLNTLRHRNVNDALLAEAEVEVITAITKFEPRADVQEIEVFPLKNQPKGFQIKVHWLPVTKPTIRNAVITDMKTTEVEI